MKWWPFNGGFGLALLLTASTALAGGFETPPEVQGRLILTQLVSAPFPHPARAAGHSYQGKLFSAAQCYEDSTVAIFIPRGFRTAGPIDFVVHFHGWNNSVTGALSGYRLIEQFAGARKNAVLVVPEGPRNAPDSFGGKLEDAGGFKKFMAEVLSTLRGRLDSEPTRLEAGRIILSGHSGGYHVMAAILDRGAMTDRVKEVWLFDALYGGTEAFLAWADAGHRRLVDIYTDHGGTKAETERLMQLLKVRGTAFFAAEDAEATPSELQSQPWILLHTNLPHNDVVAKRSTFREFLETSCLDDLPSK